MIKLKCKICNAEFFVEDKRSRHRLYCDNCRYIKCVFCGKKFLIKAGEKEPSRFCSKKCYSSWQKGIKKSPGFIERLADFNRGKKTGTFIKCAYCGKVVYKYPRDMKRGKGIRKFCSKECFIKYKIENGSPKRNNKEVEKNWKKAIFKRDDYTCQDCGQRGGILNAHHIKSWANYPDLRFDISNGITLCKKCHLKRHTKLKPMICKYCGKEFEPNYRVKAIKKFCSHNCRQKYWLIKRSEERANAPKKDTYRIHNIEALKTEFKEEDYKQNFKDYCVSCGKPIDMDWGHYVAYGNYCKECDRKAFENSQHNIEPVEYKIIRKALVEIGAE